MSLTIDAIMTDLLKMPVGTTGTRWDVCVTRWSADRFETRTWGRRPTLSAYDAAAEIFASVRS
jgi:hypothetical protein